MKYGIDKISFYVPKYYLDMKSLAEKRGINKDKYLIGLEQHKMSILPPNEDIVTMGASAGNCIINKEDRANIDLLVFTTESGIDQSKSAGIYIHKLLNLKPSCRVVELKQACYSSTAGLRFAINHIQINPNSKALVIASDNARYGLDTAGEATQGCGAVAMLITANPKVMSFDNYTGFVTKDTMDFWRPNYRDEALVDGKYSMKLYLSTMIESWKEYKSKSGRELSDHHKICYHMPFTKMAEKAHKKLCKFENNELENNFEKYNKIVGNCYTASLYLSLISLLDSKEELKNKRIGMFAYGSGCVAEFFSGVVQSNYKKYLYKNKHLEILQNRIEIDYNTYEEFYNFKYPINGERIVLNFKNDSKFILAEINQHKRIYRKNMKKVFIIDGASGCGKTSVALKLQEVSDNNHYIASSTIRPMRPEEINGREHFFLSMDEFNKKKDNGAFLGYYDMYFNKYGIEKEKVLGSDKDNIILTYHSEEGTLKNDIKDIGLEFTTILILPDDEDTLRGRIVRRNPKLEEHKIQARLDKYKEILAYKGKYDYVFVNKEGKLEELVKEILNVINK